MPLESGIRKRHNHAFVLDEDSLRRIEGLLEKHSHDYGNPLELVYRVEREDDRFYETHSLDHVLSDPNALTKRIDSLHIELRAKALPTDELPEVPPILQIKFEKHDRPAFLRFSVSMRISSPNRTWALLVADDIEPQIQRTFRAKQVPRWTLALLLVPLAPLIYRMSKFLEPDKFTPGKGILMTSVLLVTLAMMSFVVIAGPFGSPRWFRRVFGPESTFLWGGELENHGDREQTRRNLFWVVLVGFLVSLAASLASLWF